MDMSPWLCGECGCQEIAFGLEACPQCGAPAAAADSSAPSAAKKTAAAKTVQE